MLLTMAYNNKPFIKKPSQKSGKPDIKAYKLSVKDDNSFQRSR